MLRRINRKVQRYKVGRIALKVPSYTHHSDGLTSLIAAIKAYCSLHDLQLQVYTIKDIKEHGTLDTTKNKRLLVQSLGDKYPQLYYRAQRELRSRNRHYTKMFEAVAVAELSVQKM